ncbi:MAG: low temperature requirement protein A, partial [Gemmatimonadales bacterium]
WALAIALDLLAAGVGGQREGWNLHPEHFVERHGLIVIIALGETLIVAAAGLAGAPRFPVAIATAVLAVAVSGALWWSYFPYIKPALERALRRNDGSARSTMARDAFSVVHFPMLCGVVAIAVAEKEALVHPAVTFPLSMRVTFAAGLVLFVWGTALAIWRATGVVLPWRWVLVLAGVAGVLTLATEPWVPFGLVTVVLVALTLLEHRVFRRADRLTV